MWGILVLTNDQLLGDLLAHYGVRVDRRGEAHVNCPSCGKQVKKGQTHFSFSIRGGKCQVCGYKTGLYALYQSAIGEREVVERPIVPPKPPTREVTPLNMSLAHYWEHYLPDDTVDRWQAYKPLTKSQIDRYSLGYGVLPRSACKHPRLTVPVLDKDGAILHIRGRNAGCSCETKWAVSGGWTMNRLEPYNVHAPEAFAPPIILIVENPIDAIMATDPINKRAMLELLVPQMNQPAASAVNRHFSHEKERYPVVALATLSVSYWRDSWAEYLREADQVFVMYDNDLPGNGGAKNRNEFIRLWQDGDEDRPIPPAKGIQLANRLRKAHLPATLFDWGDRPRKYDVGDYLKGVQHD
jgi:hypothetical protein